MVSGGPLTTPSSAISPPVGVSVGMGREGATGRASPFCRGC
jgi:hypothetical protein